MNEKLEKDVRVLKLYAVLSTLTLFSLIGYISLSSNKFSQIDVERINIVEPNGDLRIVISNKEHQHPGILNGKVIPRKAKRPAGIIFFNDIGDETGGIGFQTHENGHYGHMAFDKLGHDQSIAMTHSEDKTGDHQVGFRVWQRPKGTVWDSIDVAKKIKEIKDTNKRKKAYQEARKNGLIHSERLFLGKRKNNDVELVLSDSLARPRIVLRVTKDGDPEIEFLNEEGKRAKILSPL